MKSQCQKAKGVHISYGNMVENPETQFCPWATGTVLGFVIFFLALIEYSRCKLYYSCGKLELHVCFCRFYVWRDILANLLKRFQVFLFLLLMTSFGVPLH